MTDAAPPEAPARPRPAPGRGRLVGAIPAAWSLFFGPVFDKEMRVSGRKLGPFITRLVFALCLLAVAALAFTSAWQQRGWLAESGVAELQSTQQIAPALAEAVLWTQFVAVLLVAPILSSGGVADERRRRTLSAIMSSPVRASEIVFNKIAAALVGVALVSLIGVPLLLGLRAYGGLSAERVLAASVLTLAVAALGVSVGTFISSRRGAGRGSTLASVFVFACAVGAPPMLLGIWNATAAAAAQATQGAVALPSVPLPVVLGSSVAPAMGVAHSPFVPFPPELARQVWLGCTAWTLTLAALYALRATRNVATLRKTDVDDDTPAARATLKREARLERRHAKKANRLARRAAAAGEPGVVPPPPPPPAVRERRSREVTGEPVLWRELRQPMFATRARRIGAVVAAVLLMVFLYYTVARGNARGLPSPIDIAGFGSPFEGPGAHMFVTIPAVLVALLQAATATTGAVSVEREARTWDVLLTTRVTVRQIITAKLVGALRRQWLAPLVLAMHWAVAIVAGWAHPAILPMLVLSVLPAVLLLNCTGLALSLVLRKPVTAAGVNLGLAFGAWAVLPMLVAMIGELVWAAESFWPADAALFANPVFAAPAAVDQLAGRPLNRLGLADFAIERPGSWSLDDIRFGWWVGLQAAIGVGYALLAALALLATFGRFGRLGGRTS